MRASANPAIIIVTGQSGEPSGCLRIAGANVPAMLGRSGLVARGAAKVEGDGATPVGSFALRQVYYRADRRSRPQTRLPVTAIRRHDMWCDDPDHALYNRPVSAPFAASAEQMWRESRVYDICIVLDYNLARPARGEGSAIFFHLTRRDEAPPPTEGCVAISPASMDLILPLLRVGSVMKIEHS